MKASEKLRESLSSVLEQQDRIQRIVEESSIPKESVSCSELEALKEITSDSDVGIIQVNSTAISAFTESSRLLSTSIVVGHTGECGIKSAIQFCQFASPALMAIEEWNSIVFANFAEKLNTLVISTAAQEFQFASSNICKWLQEVALFSLTSIFENIQNFRLDYEYKRINEGFQKAMFNARWFPYAGWNADIKIAYELVEILETSRASKNRVKRIDKLIFSYYDKKRISNLKRIWRQKNLPSYMTRILVQSICAYHRREYALTVSALSTLWEGIIQDKVNDDGYRISRKTRENLTKLISENEFNKIFSSFCEEFIFYNCNNVNEVKPDVPGRHGIAHCWYNTYPSKKMALNAILFTDFLLGLKPLEKT